VEGLSIRQINIPPPDDRGTVCSTP